MVSSMAGKTKVEGKRMEYRFDPNNPVVKKIVDKAEARAKDQTTENKLEPDEDQVEGVC